MYMNPEIQFEVLINDSFENINSQEGLVPIHNKKVLSLINDFEDGSWRYTKFHDFIWDNVVETALSKSERDKLINHDHTRLRTAAMNLRLTDKDKKGKDNKKGEYIGKGSELAEIVLYGIMKQYYSALSVVPKIFYKQNSKDNAKGADSVHIVLEGDNDFSLWFGEAKFYNSIEDTRLDSIIESVGNSLQTDKIKKENSIITNIQDLDLVINNAELLNRIKTLLSERTSIDDLKPKLHIPILLLHQCEITKSCKEMSGEYINQIIDYHKDRAQAFFTKQISKLSESINKYSSITFHLILFPVPDKKIIVDKFIKTVEFYKEQ